jgi:glyoxylase-like metal-dependent hydrolase (beta-lactamase superfamily II)
MNIKTLILGPLQVNCYILWETEQCLVIDPGFEPERVMKTCDELGLKIQAILLTHGHFDHVGGVKKIAEKTGCQVFLHPDELSLPPFITSGKLYYTDTYAEGDEITLADMTFTVLHTPGHTPGAVCLHFGDHLFTGDTLFAGSCGRTDLPGGSFATIKASLKRLASLPGNASIYPGHGEETTLETERKNNPYIY